MKDRKQAVINSAHQLFIQKGFHATSIQDILDESGISKGTFYNYFSSKNDLLIKLSEQTIVDLEQAQNQLLIGQDPADIDIFVEQLILFVEMYKSNGINSILEELFFSDDEELKRFIRVRQLKNKRWLYHRFIDIFGVDKKPYLLDCSIMLIGMLSSLIKYVALQGKPLDCNRIIHYIMNRMVKVVEEVSRSKEQLNAENSLNLLLLEARYQQESICQQFEEVITSLKEKFLDHHEREKCLELIDFIHGEVTQQNPRKFLIESTLKTLREQGDDIDHINEEMACFEKIIKLFLSRRSS